jgi:signal transduction histidine kinase
VPINISPSLLLVTPDGDGAEGCAAALRAAIPDATWTLCPSIDAAEAYLAGASFDAVVVDEGINGLDGTDARGLGVRLGAPVHVFRAGDAGAVRAALKGGDDPRAQLDEVRIALGRAVHDANNPLTVITGNAQYALEMARTLDLDASLMRSLEDIDEAGRRMEAAMATLAALRQRLSNGLASGDGLG